MTCFMQNYAMRSLLCKQAMHILYGIERIVAFTGHLDNGRVYTVSVSKAEGGVQSSPKVMLSFYACQLMLTYLCCWQWIDMQFEALYCIGIVRIEG